MVNLKIKERSKKFNNISIFEKDPPSKLTECRQLKLHTQGWGILTEYYLESVKINAYDNIVNSVATLKVSDRSGQITCVVRGTAVGMLFGLNAEEWKDVEALCNVNEQLFYRAFKDGLSRDFRYEQQLFYNFCACGVKEDVFVVLFRRCVNWRNKDKNNAFLDILQLQKCDKYVLQLYINHYKDSINLINKLPKESS